MLLKISRMVGSSLEEAYFGIQYGYVAVSVGNRTSQLMILGVMLSMRIIWMKISLMLQQLPAMT